MRLALPPAAARTKPASDAPRLAIRLLGSFAIESAGVKHDEAVWQRVHARRLVQLIGSTSQLHESRELVLRTLWPDFDEARARNRLHHTVHLIRKSLEALPLSTRPQWEVNSARVTLSLPPLTVVDAQRFIQALDADAPDDAARLSQIELALDWYRGELAGDWADNSEITTRRTWLARQHADALAEAVTLSIDLERYDRATKYAERRAHLLPNDVEAQCVYAELLMEHGRADAALKHCQAARQIFESDGDVAPAKLDAIARTIQQRVNAASAKDAVPATVRRSFDVFAVEGLPLRKPLLGFERTLAAATQCLFDPHGQVVSLVGPPGSGKTAIAIELAHSCHSRFAHGVLWIDCWGIEMTLDALVLQLAEKVGVSAAQPAVQAAAHSASALHAVLGELRARELLVVLDGLEFGAAAAAAFAPLLGANCDARWLVTAWSSLNLRFEKAVLIDSSELLAVEDDSTTTTTAASAAACLVASVGQHAWRLEDKRIRKTVEAIAMSADGLPNLLESAARALQTIWPNELLAKLERDPAALLRTDDSQGLQGTHDLVRWLRSAPPQVLRLLSIASHCHNWLTRLDLAMLLDCEQPCDVDSLIDYCATHHYLRRRIRHDHHESWSEFKVPRYCKAALLLCDDVLDVSAVQKHLERWLTGSPRQLALPLSTGSRNRSEIEWFDDRIEDFDALIRRWHAQGCDAEIANFCLAQTACWSTSAHTALALQWLHLIGESMDGLADEIAARLLVKRARLSARLGQMQAAYDDASCALRRSAAETAGSVHHEAVRLIERYGKTRHDANACSPVVSARGIDAGESLLRIAQLAAKHGDPQRAMQLCNEAVAVFTYFGLARGGLRTHKYRARIAYGMGDTALALQCISQCEAAARSLGESQGISCAELMRANVLLSDAQFGRAIELASAVLARPQTASSPTLLARGLLVLGWGYYATGALPVLHAMSKGLIEQTNLAEEPGARASAELLAMLVLARQGQPQAALRHARPILDLLAQRPRLPDSQGDLMNAIELAQHLERPALARSLIASLNSVGNSAHHRLRPWTVLRLEAAKERLCGLTEHDNLTLLPAAGDDTNLRWVLRTLLSD